MNNELLIGLSFTAIGGFLVVQSIMSLLRGIDSEDWPKVQGEILDSRVDDSYNGEGTAYVPVVHYRFLYDGVSYVSKNIKVGSTFSSSLRSVAKETSEKFHAGRIVTVFVCSKNPSKSVLFPGFSKTLYFTSALGTVFFAVGVRYLLSHFGIEFGN